MAETSTHPMMGMFMRLMRVLMAVLVLLGAVIPGTLPARADVDIYVTEGLHHVNGRQWRTSCEPYSQTKRCRTEIWATQIHHDGARFVQTNGWVFNNLAYAASPRSLWRGNPLAANGEVGGEIRWTATDGRRWRTECDTPLTGRGGCRSYIEASVIEATSSGYQWRTTWIFNNLVRFTTDTGGGAPTPAPTPPNPTPAPTGHAADLLAQLPIKGRAPKTGYARDQFGQTWADVDRNGCDTRNDILNRDLTNKTYRAGTRDCIVETGTLVDPFTAATIQFVRGQTTSNAVQIDHVVALSDAWQKGAQQLTLTERTAFANDPVNLIAVDGPSNAAKGDGDAATWLPPNKAYRCEYVARQVGTKHKYRLWVTQAERDAIARILRACPGQRVPTPDAAPVVGR